MEYHTVDEQEASQALAIELLQQAERCILADLPWQAEGLLLQAWVIAKKCDLDIASQAAWEAAWLLVRKGVYTEAAKWFERVVFLPSKSKALWPAARQALVQICHLLVANPPATSLALPFPSQSLALQDRSPPELPQLSVRSLGCFQVIRAGSILPNCRARKSIALFRYLLTRHHRTAHKEELMELLWPDAHPREAAHSLHVAINALRRYIDPAASSYLLFEAGYYSISPNAPLENDCDTFEQLINAAQQSWRASDLLHAEQGFSRAIACYKGDYQILAYDLTWALATRERLLACYLSALDNLGRIYLEQRRFQQAAECYQRLLERDEYREDAHCQLIRCYSELGRRSEVLQQYKRCATLLANDLGLEPMQETQALYRAIVGTNNS